MTVRHRQKDRSGAHRQAVVALHKNTFATRFSRRFSTSIPSSATSSRRGDAASLIDQNGRHSVPFGRRKPTRGADECLKKLKCASKARGPVAAKKIERGRDGILAEFQF